MAHSLACSLSSLSLSSTCSSAPDQRQYPYVKCCVLLLFCCFSSFASSAAVVGIGGRADVAAAADAADCARQKERERSFLYQFSK